MMETLNYLHDESLIVELKPEEAETMQGGVGLSRYTTKGVSSYLNIRSGPGTNYKVVGRWYPGQINYLQVPAIVKNGFRKFAFDVNQWVSTKYIKFVG
ncbi:MAG: SH3 domain-containing protein [Nostoc sp.]|uniref:SH3 domain-containing protein n=1 Tax=Nostoc sp. TaxID=1180 RepID=UPI002FF73A9F